ncbi:MAG TPA: NAD(P)H-dependent oxidoreductase [Burkholderiales bacterium]|nr:NAD(P)H-dependent oxidoreductase [Burkholderiales bacterium]
MKTLLQLNTSLYGDAGQSSRLASRFAEGWKARNPDGVVLRRDLSRAEVPHLTAERFQALLAKPEVRTPEQQAVVADSDALIAELRRADVIVIGLPLYNFAIPSTLKAYIDHVARAGVTFRYTDKGPVGLLTGKQAYVFAARGGNYAGTSTDTQTAYVRYMLAFLGITEVEFVYAEGLAIDEATREKALAGARVRADALAGAQLALAA